MKVYSIRPIVLSLIIAIGLTLSLAGVTSALTYGAGTYGTCQYGSCSISLNIVSPVNLTVTPSSTTTCSVAQQNVEVGTSSSTGFTLQLENQSATTASMNGSVHGSSIAAISGTPSVPAALTAGTWGYRVDSLSSFGAGPTSGVSSGGIPSESFAGVPLSGSAFTLRQYTSTAPSNPDTTSVWYGACADLTVPADAYASTVTYTALIN